ncbi:MAG: hypothetical protein HYX36_08330 [Rhizobiales bacterium]|nr:hypothetical protein [Hyphomicrobiales bacterium]
MASKSKTVINNQIFLGLPWKTVKPKYEKVIAKLEKKYPLYLTIVGRNDDQNAANLFEVIKKRISASSEAIFDATGGNPNVEPPRDCRRLQLLRRWSYDEQDNEQVFN